MEYRNSQYLTDSQWLYDNPGREKVKTFDCTTFNEDLYALALMGKESGIALYDGSVSEWANTSDAPMESDV